MRPNRGWQLRLVPGPDSRSRRLLIQGERVCHAMPAARRLHRVAGGFGRVLPSGRGGPPERAIGKLVHGPARVLLEPVVAPAFRPAITQARASARLVRGVVLEVGLGRGSSATWPGACGVPDLGQVPELDPGIMPGGLEPVIALRGIDRIEPDQQVRPASRDAQPPGPGLGRGREREPRPVPRPRSGSLPVPARFGPGAAVSDGVPLPVGHRHAPRRPGVGRGRGGQVPGQPRVSQSRSKYTKGATQDTPSEAS